MRVTNYPLVFVIELITLVEDNYAIDIKIRDVAEYDGKSDLQLFLEKLETFFSLKAKLFPKSQYQRKIQYISTRLVGGPGQWWIANKGKLDGSGEAGTIWGTYKEFLAELKLSFDNPNRLEEARDSLDTLIQGDEKTAAFLAKFWALQVEAWFTVNELWSRLWSTVDQKQEMKSRGLALGLASIMVLLLQRKVVII